MDASIGEEPPSTHPGVRANVLETTSRANPRNHSSIGLPSVRPAGFYPEVFSRPVLIRSASFAVRDSAEDVASAIRNPLGRPTRKLIPALVLAWICLIVVIDAAAGRALQIAVENVGTRAAATETAQPVDIPDTARPCPVLDRSVHRSMTIDELNNLRDRLCPVLSEPQRDGN